MSLNFKGDKSYYIWKDQEDMRFKFWMVHPKDTDTYVHLLWHAFVKIELKEKGEREREEVRGLVCTSVTKNKNSIWKL